MPQGPLWGNCCSLSPAPHPNPHISRRCGRGRGARRAGGSLRSPRRAARAHTCVLSPPGLLRAPSALRGLRRDSVRGLSEMPASPPSPIILSPPKPFRRWQSPSKRVVHQLFPPTPQEGGAGLAPTVRMQAWRLGAAGPGRAGVALGPGV